MKEIYIIKKLPFGFWFKQMWPGQFMIQKGGNPHGDWGKNKEERDWIKYIYWPWGKTTNPDISYLCKNGSYEIAPRGIESFDWVEKNAWSAIYPVSYKMKYVNETQEANATVKIRRYRHHHHYLGFVRFLYPWKPTLDISFDEELGSERGSWKGGVVGISSDIKKGESVEQCLERTMKEQSFCR